MQTSSRLFTSAPKPFFNHSFITTVFEADIAVNDERVSERVCLLLEKSRSTDILMPGMARMSLAIQAKIG